MPKHLTDYNADLLIESNEHEIGSWKLTSGDIVFGVHDRNTHDQVATILNREEMCRLRDYLNMVIEGDE